METTRREFTGHKARIHRTLTEQFADASNKIQGHEEMLVIARSRNMEAEIERQLDNISEWEREEEAIREAAIGYGFEPEDFE
jgi:hypothetical protein